jgi:hypothetical protein
LRWWLLLQGSENEDGELQVCAGAKLVYATRNPGSIRALIAQGKFGDIGRGLLALIPQPQASPLPISDHQFRLIHGDGKWWALFSVAQSGIQKLVLPWLRAFGPSRARNESGNVVAPFNRGALMPRIAG